MTTYKDFLGINICIYDPILGDTGAIGGNTLGYDPNSTFKYNDNAGVGNVSKLTEHASPQTLVLLNLHRNGPYGYPTWKQIRTSQNPLSRAYRLSNTFTYVQEPGALLGTKQAKYGNIISLKEPTISSNLPISLIGEVAIYNEELGTFEKKPVEIKTAFNNETAFFANQQANEYFNTISQTDENYETLKEMYLDGGLDDEGSLLDSFSLLTYRQTIWPKQQFAYLNRTRSRTFYVNTFWRNNREDREKKDVEMIYGFAAMSQSMWPLDAAKDFATRTAPGVSGLQILHRIGGSLSSQNTEGGEGVLQNSYSHVFRGMYNAFNNDSPITGSATIVDNPDLVLSASLSYAMRHTLKSTFSNFNPSFPTFNTGSGKRYDDQYEGASLSLLTLNGSASMMLTSSLFEGAANWDAPSQAGKTPFYDSYDDYSQEIKRSGKGYSIIPEFRISSHVDTYASKGITSELKEIFELSGALTQNTTTENEGTFYKVLSNSDFLKHFDLIKKDHEGFADEKILTLKCKAIKKFLPYEGFYPAQRTVQLGEQFVKSYGKHVVSRSPTNSALTDSTGSFRMQPLLIPLFAPGILFNTIKSGVGVDFPIFTGDSGGFIVSSSNNNYTDFWNNNSTNINKTTPFMATEGPHQNYYWAGSSLANNSASLESAYDERIPFEALVEPEEYLAGLKLIIQEPHPFGMPFTSSARNGLPQFLEYQTEWDGRGDNLYKKMANNLLAEIPELFLENTSLTTISSLEDGDPTFGNTTAGTYYAMRIKMKRSRVNNNQPLAGFAAAPVDPPQDVVTYQDRNSASSITGSVGAIKARFSTKESLTMYSRPSAFGPATYGGNGYGTYRSIRFRECGSWWGTNYPYTPPYYHGEAWCDLIFYAAESKKYTLDEILSGSKEYPYYTRHWWNGTMDTLRDLTGYSGSGNSSALSTSQFVMGEITEGKYKKYVNSPWYDLISNSGKEVTVWPNAASHTTAEINNLDSFMGPNWGTNATDAESMGTAQGTNQLRYRFRPNGSGSNFSAEDQLIQHPFYINYNAMQLDSSINLFGKGTVRRIFDQNTQLAAEVASADTIRGKTRWIIQPKFETPILNFKKYEKLTANGGTLPLYASESVPRGMWHQYGNIPEDASTGVFLQVADVPSSWFRGALGLQRVQAKNIRSLADLVGFSKDQVRLGEVASKREVSEAVVAVPFIEQGATRKFFSIPRVDIDSSIEASRREIDGRFPAGGPPKAGDTVYQMVKNMQKYVFPPSMDFVKYKEVDPFAMYIFEFKHTFSKQDLADMWQNLPPEIGRTFEEAEASISHELLSAELLGDGAVVKNGVLDENAEGKGVPSNIQWMVFKVKKRAKTNYFDKIIAKKGTTDDTSGVELVGVTNAVTSKKDKDITYNWPYDFFSLVELVKIDAEVSFANIVNDDKGQKSIKKVESKKTRKPSSINKARGKG